jgi:hypothetical protein
MNFENYIMPMLALGMIHLVIMGLSKLSDHNHNKFHIYDGLAGYILLIFRILIFIYF